MKSRTILAYILLLAFAHCEIMNPVDPTPINVGRLSPRNEVPAPSQWMGLNDFLQISKADRLGDVDPKNINAELLLRQARQKRVQLQTSKRPSDVPTFEELGIDRDEMIAQTEKMLGMQGLHKMKMSEVNWDDVAKKIESLPKTVQSAAPSNNRTRLLFNFYKLCAFVFAAFCVALIVLIIIL